MALPATRPTAAIPSGAALSSDQLLEIYYYLRLTRTLEERLVALYRQTKVIGGLFRSLGQEGESVASAYALERGRNKDILSPLIRNLGSMLVMGARPVEILRQYMAKADPNLTLPSSHRVRQRLQLLQLLFVPDGQEDVARLEWGFRVGIEHHVPRAFFDGYDDDSQVRA